MFDTHCHLNFGAFDAKVDEVVADALAAGITQMVIPSTDVATAEKALKVATPFKHIHVAVGIHPHHVFELKTHTEKLNEDLSKIESLLHLDKVVAVGEVGLDRHYYKNTRYGDYEITNEFMRTQREVFTHQVKFAIAHDKSLVLHNRESKEEFIAALLSVWDSKLEGRTVFHCCEPDNELLEFAQSHKMFIGVDGDVTYSKQKQEFIKRVPLEMLVLETDAPFLSPEPFRSTPRETRGPNVPANLRIIAEFVAKLKGLSTDQLAQTTTANAQRLFHLV